MMFEYIFLLGLPHILAGLSIVGYDCQNPLSVNLTRISLREVQRCPEVPSDYSETSMSIQVVQRKEVKSIIVRNCHVKITRTIFYCGMYSHNSIVNNGILTYIKQLNAETCQKAHKYKSIEIFPERPISNIKINSTMFITFTLSGHLTMNGACEGAIFSENSQIWENVVVLANLELFFSEYSALITLTDNQIHLKNNVVCPFLSQYCFDTLIGDNVWPVINPTQCEEDNYDVLYEGDAKIIGVTNVQEGAPPNQYSVIETDEHVFALALIQNATMCKEALWITEHPEIIIIPQHATQFRLKKHSTLSAHNVNLVSYVNSKFLYVEITHKKALNSISMDALHHRCEQERKILYQKLFLARTSADGVAMLLQNFPGVTALVRGEVLYLMQCTPVVTNIRITNLCYADLPITFDNKSLFLTPSTHIIKQYSSEIQCNEKTIPLYYINGTWVGFAPHPIIAEIPITLEVSKEPKLKFYPVKQISQGGLYTANEIRLLQQTFLFPLEQKAISNMIVRKMINLKSDNQGLSITSLFDPTDMSALTESLVHSFLGYVTKFGTFISALIGIYFLFCIIHFLVRVLLNALSLYQSGGCGPTLLASFSTPSTSYVLQRKNDTPFVNLKNPTAADLEI